MWASPRRRAVLGVLALLAGAGAAAGWGVIRTARRGRDEGVRAAIDEGMAAGAAARDGDPTAEVAAV